MGLDVDIKHFDELTLLELHGLLALRSRVFVVEQQITEVPEVDGEDKNGHHVIARVDGEIIGTVRMLLERNPVKVGRVAVDKAWRGRGVGGAMMDAAGEFLGDRSAKLHAQSHLEGWYEALGWWRGGDNFEIVGIDHVPMYWPPEEG